MEERKFSEPQKRMLQQKLQRAQMAQNDLNEFVAFLREEHGVDLTWQMTPEGFMKPEKKV